MSRSKAGNALRAAPAISAPEAHRRPRIALVIPAYNEEKSIENVLREIHSLRLRLGAWELYPVVVNDGSSDRTGEVLVQIASSYGAHVVTLPLNLGIGRAVQTGFRYAVSQLRADVTLQLDGDGQHPAEQIALLVEPVLSGQADVTVGSRYLPGASGNVSTPLRQAGTFFFSVLLRLLIGVQIKDSTSGFRAFSYEATEFLSRYYPDDYPEVEAYIPLARQGFRIRECAVAMRPRAVGRSSITPVQSLYYLCKVAFATVVNRLRPLPVRRARPVAPGSGQA